MNKNLLDIQYNLNGSIDDLYERLKEEDNEGLRYLVQVISNLEKVSSELYKFNLSLPLNLQLINKESND